MTKLTSTLAFVFLSFFVCPFIGISQDVIITEVMVNPSQVQDNKGEWFELYNNTSSSIDINGWEIRSKKPSGYQTHTISGSLVIPSGGYIVLAINGNFNANGGINEDYDYNSIRFKNNTNPYTDDLVIRDASGTTIDSVTLDSDFPKILGKSAKLVDFSSDNSIGTSWASTTLFTYGDGDYGTPGMTNDPEAKIGTTPYTTLNDAINAASSGEVVELLKGVTDALAEIPSGITLDIELGAEYINTNSLTNNGTIDISSGGAFTNNGVYKGNGVFIGDFVNPLGGTISTESTPSGSN